MVLKKIISLFAIVGVIFAVLFEVRLPLNFARIEFVQVPDPDVEAEYGRCYEVRDEEMHRAVFDAVDNPDVQKEMISTNRESIARECRQRFPEQMITIEKDVATNLVNLKSRFW